MFLSLSFFLPSPLSKNKEIKIFIKKTNRTSLFEVQAHRVLSLAQQMDLLQLPV